MSNGAGGNNTFTVAAGDNLTVDSFGAFGTGTTASNAGELDTLKFTSSGMSAANMALTQSGANVVVTFDGVPNTSVTLTNITIDQLDNVGNQGNFIFAGQSGVVDTIDVLNDPSAATVAHANVSTFLTDGTYSFSGKDNSNDTIRSTGSGNDVLNGLGGNDHLAGGAGNDTLTGGAGNDILDGGTGNDHMDGGAGNDTYFIDSASDVIVDPLSGVAGGIDTVVSSISYTLATTLENLTLTGSVGLTGNGNDLDNIIIGTDGNDKLGGGNGNDTLNGGAGNDLMTGGAGNDTYFVDAANDVVRETLTNAQGGGIDTVISSITYKLGDTLDNLTLTGTGNINGTGNGSDNVIIGNAGNNTLSGGVGNDTLTGGDGNDGLSGGTGNDVLDGGKGSDILNGNAGADTMSGGAGSDNYIVEDLGDQAIETLTNAAGGGIDKVTSTVSFSLGDNLDNLVLSGTGDIAGAGNDLANIIAGNSGNNLISGGGGNDVISGGDGNDIITGGSGDDQMHGGNGNDAFYLNKGDFVTGDAGDDTFRVLETGFTRIDGGTGIDRVTLEGLGASINLTGTIATTMRSIEVIDLKDSETQTLTLDAASVVNMSGGAVGKNTLIIQDDATDTINLDSSWKLTGQQVNPSGQAGTYDVFTSGASTLLVEHHFAPTNPPVPTLAGLDGTNGFRIDGNVDNGETSFWVRSAGDVNGDGVDDLIVGSREGGSAYVVYGHTGTFADEINLSTLNGTNGFHIINAGHTDGISSSVPYGVSVSGAGDVNGDGIADFIVGTYASTSDPLLSGNGSAYLIYGKVGGFGATLDLAHLNAADGVRINGPEAGDGLGTNVSAAGDVNGDGYDDLIIGADVASPDGRNVAGSAFVVFGHAGGFTSDLSTLDGTNGFRIDGPTADGELGRTVSSAGDINGDGFADIIVGAPHLTYGATPGVGTAYVIYGHPGTFNAVQEVDKLGTAEGFSITGTALSDGTGISISAAGDINGDGLGDLIVGAVPVAASAAYGAGVSYVLLGQTGGFGSVDLTHLSPTQGFAIHGDKLGDYAGNSVSAAGDVNGDGYADLLIGAPTAGDNHAGVAYVVYGHAGGFGDIDLSQIDGTNGFRIDGLSNGDYTGYPVAAGGDINGDGFADIIVGAYLADPNGHTDAGSSYVIFGGNFTGAVAHIGSTAAETQNGTSASESFAAGGGDDTINGGGGKDVIYAGAGNDQIHVTDNTFFRIDGGGGVDTLHLDYKGAIDLGNIDADGGTVDRGKIANIETISIDNGFANAMTLHATDVLDLDPTVANVGGKASVDDVLKIDGDKGDTLSLSSFEGWGAADTSSLPGYAIYTANHDIKIAVDTDITVTVN